MGTGGLDNPLIGPAKFPIQNNATDTALSAARIPPLYVGATATAEVGTLQLRWLRMSPSLRGYSETQACKHPLPERAHITNLETGPGVSSHVLASVGSGLMMLTGLNGVLRGLVGHPARTRIAPENNASTGGFERLQPIKRCHHCFAVENMGRQTLSWSVWQK